MAEIRIPYDRIPADVLQCLKNISNEVISPFQTTNNGASSLSSPSSSSLSSSSSSSSTVTATPSSLSSITTALSEAGLSHFPACLTTQPSSVSSPSSSSSSTSSSSLSSLSSSSKSTSSNPTSDILRSGVSKNRRGIPTASIPSPDDEDVPNDDGHDGMDEVDGGDVDSIVHAVDPEALRHQKSSHVPNREVMDDSDIIRIFPNGKNDLGSNGSANSFSSEYSGIVRVFPDDDDDGKDEDEEDKNADNNEEKPEDKNNNGDDDDDDDDDDEMNNDVVDHMTTSSANLKQRNRNIDENSRMTSAKKPVFKISPMKVPNFIQPDVNNSYSKTHDLATLSNSDDDLPQNDSGCRPKLRQINSGPSGNQDELLTTRKFRSRSRFSPYKADHAKQLNSSSRLHHRPMFNNDEEAYVIGNTQSSYEQQQQQHHHHHHQQQQQHHLQQKQQQIQQQQQQQQQHHQHLQRLLASHNSSAITEKLQQIGANGIESYYPSLQNGPMRTSNLIRSNKAPKYNNNNNNNNNDLLNNVLNLPTTPSQFVNTTETTPTKILRKNSSNFGNIRRSPGLLPTPPRTPDDADADDDDEVFSYDVISRNGRPEDALNSCNEPAQHVHNSAHLRHLSDNRTNDLEMAVRRSSSSRSSPFHFSPSNKMARMRVGDGLQQTRKRLSFEDMDSTVGSSQCGVDRSDSQQTWSGYNAQQDLSSRQQCPAPRSSKSLSVQNSKNPARRKSLSPFNSPPRSHSSAHPSASPASFPFEMFESLTDFDSDRRFIQPYSEINVCCSGSTICQSSSSSSHPSSHQQLLVVPSNNSCQSPLISPYSDRLQRPVERTPRQRVLSEGFSEESTEQLGAISRSINSNDDDPLHPVRPRGQTASSINKRRRLGDDEEEDDTDLKAIQTLMHSPPQQSSPQSTFTANFNESVNFPGARNSAPPPSSTLQPLAVTSQNAETSPHPNGQKTSAPQENCWCATILRNFFSAASRVFHQLRYVDPTTEHYRQEMTKTNEMLRESMFTMTHIKALCEHNSSISTSSATPATMEAGNPSSSTDPADDIMTSHLESTSTAPLFPPFNMQQQH